MLYLINNKIMEKKIFSPRNLLELLPDEFTLEDAKRMCRQIGKGTERAINMIRIWKSRNYVFQISDFSFQKSERFKRK